MKMPLTVAAYDRVRDTDDWQEKPELNGHAEFEECSMHLQPHKSRFKRQWWPFLCTLMVLVGTTALVLVLLGVVNNKSLSLTHRSPIPDFPTQNVLLNPDYEYEAPASPESDALWDSNLPGDKGFIFIEDPEKYGLPPGLPSLNGTATYGVTWTHEYHCLKLIRTEFWKALYGTSHLYGGQDAKPALSRLDDRRLIHTQHCFDYIRQLVMCRADMTIEWAAPEPDPLGNKHHINGYGIPHTCTKWDTMYDHMMQSLPPPFVSTS